MTAIVRRRTGETLNGSLGGGSGGLFSFAPEGQALQTYSTEEWEIVPDDDQTIPAPREEAR